MTRREMLQRSGSGFGAVALAAMLAESQGLVSARALAPKESTFQPQAKSVIWLFQEGGPSGFDLFDPKPALKKWHGQKIPGVDPFFGDPGPVMDTPFAFSQHGESGAWASDVMPHTAECLDDIAMIKSVHCESNSHAPAMYQMNTGYTRSGFPSAGAWTTYGLGSENQDLPGFIVMPKNTGTKGGALNWGAGFLPGAHQGTLFNPGKSPILNLKRAAGLTDAQQRRQLDFVQSLNAQHAAQRPADSELEARIASFELAYRMQFEASEAVDLDSEPQHVRDLYGIGKEPTHDYGTKLLMARRLVERGVRFIQCYPNDQWDAHGDLKGNHTTLSRMTDQPVAGLLKDLKQRGLLDQTLVIWGGEFGRLPVSQGGVGRDHNPYGFLMWMAGGGIKGGTSVGELDELGYRIARRPISLPDIHATILHQLGLDHELLTRVHNGRRFRLTDISGTPIPEILKA